jgi:ketosteroid isomerase-like protein
MSGDRFGDKLKTFRSARRGVALALGLLLAAGGVARAQAQTQADKHLPEDKQTQESQQAQSDDPLHTASRVELDVAKVLLAQEKAWNRGDLEGYAKGYKDSPETLLLGRQVLKGYAQILEDYKHTYPTRASMGTLAFSELEVHPLSESFAICIGKFHLDRSKKEGGPADGQFSLVMEKTGEGWKIVLDHTT